MDYLDYLVNNNNLYNSLEEDSVLAKDILEKIAAREKSRKKFHFKEVARNITPMDQQPKETIRDIFSTFPTTKRIPTATGENLLLTPQAIAKKLGLSPNIAQNIYSKVEKADPFALKTQIARLQRDLKYKEKILAEARKYNKALLGRSRELENRLEEMPKIKEKAVRMVEGLKNYEIEELQNKLKKLSTPERILSYNILNKVLGDETLKKWTKIPNLLPASPQTLKEILTKELAGEQLKKLEELQNELKKLSTPEKILSYDILNKALGDETLKKWTKIPDLLYASPQTLKEILTKELAGEQLKKLEELQNELKRLGSPERILSYNILKKTLGRKKLKKLMEIPELPYGHRHTLREILVKNLIGDKTENLAKGLEKWKQTAKGLEQQVEKLKSEVQMKEKLEQKLREASSLISELKPKAKMGEVLSAPERILSYDILNKVLGGEKLKEWSQKAKTWSSISPEELKEMLTEELAGDKIRQYLGTINELKGESFLNALKRIGQREWKLGGLKGRAKILGGLLGGLGMLGSSLYGLKSLLGFDEGDEKIPKNSPSQDSFLDYLRKIVEGIW